MDSSEFVVDSAVYTFEEVIRAAHRLSGACYIEVVRRPNAHAVLVSALPGMAVPVDARARFFTDLADEKLRSLIRAETKGLHEQLVHAAISQAMPGAGFGP
jgi:His-Xaa-Ser system protein HxsD